MKSLKLHDGQFLVNDSGQIVGALGADGKEYIFGSVFNKDSIINTDLLYNPENYIVKLSNKGHPGVVVPSLAALDAATYTQTNNVISINSPGHNLSNILNGSTVYLAIASGLTSPGWKTGFTYVDVDNFTCIDTVSQSTSGNISTNLATTVMTPLTTTIPGGLMGETGQLELQINPMWSNEAGTKTPIFKYGTQNIVAPSAAFTTTTGGRWITTIRNIEIAKQRIYGAAATAGATIPSHTISSGMVITTQDTNTDIDITASITLGSANSYFCIANLLVLLIR